MAILWGVFAGLFNGVGALLIYGKKSYSAIELTRYLNFAAGIMLAASFFSLLHPAVNELCLQFLGGKTEMIFAFAMLVGYCFISLLNLVIPHLHNIYSTAQKKIILFVLAIALHKIPEGLAMGIAYTNSADMGQALIIGIIMQNIPEGLSVGLSLMAVKFKRSRAVIMATLTGMTQPIGMGLGLLLGELGTSYISFFMVVAGSALLFVVINEVLPQTNSAHSDIKNSLALFLGFLIMSLLAISA